MMTKQEMLDRVVRMRGHEDRFTIWFFEIAEKLTEDQLLNAFIVLEAMTEQEEEDEEYFDDNDELGFNPYTGCFDYDC